MGFKKIKQKYDGVLYFEYYIEYVHINDLYAHMGY